MNMISEYEEKLSFFLKQSAIRIQLPEQDYDLFAGTNVTISGWGRLSAGGIAPLNLQYVEIPVIDREACANAYREINDVNDNMICAGLYGVGGKDACELQLSTTQ